MAEPLPSTHDPAHELRILYTNWRGETAWRRIVPRGLRFASTEWHPEPQWLLDAWDVEKGAERSFALRDVRACRQPGEPLPAAGEPC